MKQRILLSNRLRTTENDTNLNAVYGQSQEGHAPTSTERTYRVESGKDISSKHPPQQDIFAFQRRLYSCNTFQNQAPQTNQSNVAQPSSRPYHPQRENKRLKDRAGADPIRAGSTLPSARSSERKHPGEQTRQTVAIPIEENDRGITPGSSVMVTSKVGLLILCACGFLLFLTLFARTGRTMNSESFSAKLLSRMRVPIWFGDSNETKDFDKSKALWVNHVVLSDQNVLLLPETFESRLNIEVAPLIEKHSDRIWPESPNLHCPEGERTFLTFSLRETNCLQATISFSSPCPGSVQTYRCMEKKEVSDLRHVVVKLPSRSSRLSYTLDLLTSQSNDISNKPYSESGLTQLGVINGPFDVELSDLSKIGLKRYCSSRRHHFADDISSHSRVSQETKLISVSELKRLYGVLSKHRRRIRSISRLWDVDELSTATIDPLEHSLHGANIDQAKQNLSPEQVTSPLEGEDSIWRDLIFSSHTSPNPLNPTADNSVESIDSKTLSSNGGMSSDEEVSNEETKSQVPESENDMDEEMTAIDALDSTSPKEAENDASDNEWTGSKVTEQGSNGHYDSGSNGRNGAAVDDSHQSSPSSRHEPGSVPSTIFSPTTQFNDRNSAVPEGIDTESYELERTEGVNFEDSKDSQITQAGTKTSAFPAPKEVIVFPMPKSSSSTMSEQTQQTATNAGYINPATNSLKSSQTTSSISESQSTDAWTAPRQTNSEAHLNDVPDLGFGKSARATFNRLPSPPPAFHGGVPTITLQHPTPSPYNRFATGAATTPQILNEESVQGAANGQQQGVSAQAFYNYGGAQSNSANVGFPVNVVAANGPGNKAEHILTTNVSVAHLGSRAIVASPHMWRVQTSELQPRSAINRIPLPSNVKHKIKTNIQLANKTPRNWRNIAQTPPTQRQVVRLNPQIGNIRSTGAYRQSTLTLPHAPLRTMFPPNGGIQYPPRQSQIVRQGSANRKYIHSQRQFRS